METSLLCPESKLFAKHQLRLFARDFGRFRLPLLPLLFRVALGIRVTGYLSCARALTGVSFCTSFKHDLSE